MENPIKMDDLGVPLFLETSIYIYIHIYICIYIYYMVPAGHGRVLAHEPGGTFPCFARSLGHSPRVVEKKPAGGVSLGKEIRWL